MSKIKWNNVVTTILIISLILLWKNYTALSREVPYKVLIIQETSNPSKQIIDEIHAQETIKFTKKDYSIAELSRPRGNTVINIYYMSLNNTGLFVLSPESSLYFTTAIGDTIILKQSKDYAIIYTKNYPLLSYDDEKYELIPGFGGLFLLAEKSILPKYTYNVYLNDDSITIINNQTKFNQTITNIKQEKINLDSVSFLVYRTQNNTSNIKQVVLPSKPFSIIKINIPEDTFFVGLTTNGIDTLTFHFMSQNTIQCFIGMINTYEIVHSQNNYFFLYNKT